MILPFHDITHGYHLFKDGAAWCAVGPHFVDLMASDAGFGITKEQAVEALHRRMRKDRWWNDKVLPPLGKFFVHEFESCERNEDCETGMAQCHCRAALAANGSESR